MNKYLQSKGLQCTSAEACVYWKQTARKGITLVGVYVVDILSTGTFIKDVQEFRTDLISHFKIQTGRPLDFYLEGVPIENKDDI